MKEKSALIIFIIVLLATTAYLVAPSFFTPPPAEQKRELLVYCGITMIKPMSEIASIIEQQEDVTISLIKGGSGNLLRSIRYNSIGDLYLPGSASYIRDATAEGLVTESVHVGFNKAAMMVQKGNPKGIKNDLFELTNPNHYIVIGNPDSGSIGKETKKILVAAGLFDQTLRNARELTTDSKRLIEVLKSGEADLVINWHATSTWPDNRDQIQTLPIDNRYAQKKRLILGLLRSSKYPDISRKFMAYASSDKGREIFNRHGLYDIQ